MNSLGAENIEVSRRHQTIITGLSFSVRKGELIGLVGPNGAGKTTLLRVLAGLQPIKEGKVLLDGDTVNWHQRTEIAKKIAYLEQNSRSYWPLSVENLVMLGRLPHLEPWQRPSAKDWEIVRRVMQACDVFQFAKRSVTTLSGGEQARAMLARALATEPEILLADEPIAGLDPAHQLDVMHRLQELVADGAGVVVVMHDLSIAARYCNRLSLIFEGKISAEGDAESVLSARNLQQCYGIEAHFGKLGDDLVIIPRHRL